MNERELISWIRGAAAKSGVQVPELVAGIGDDCAIFRPRGLKEELLFTTDLLLEDVHFRRDHDVALVGHNALARGLSDIAAMGGEPRFCLVSLGVAPWADETWVKKFYRGLLRLAKSTGTALAGGDLAASQHVLCDIVVCGVVPAGKALRRSGARPGDGIYVSGKLGGAAARGYPVRKIVPRLALGQSLRGIASAAMDLSDGLSVDLHRLCLESGVAADLIASDLPVARGATPDDALHGGEDYELLFTAPRGHTTGAGQIGRIVSGEPGAVFLDGEALEPAGWDHFNYEHQDTDQR